MRLVCVVWVLHVGVLCACYVLVCVMCYVCDICGCEKEKECVRVFECE